MPVRFVKRYKTGYEVIIEAADGHLLLGGRPVESGAVFDAFAEGYAALGGVSGYFAAHFARAISSGRPLLKQLW
jgi:hypothetical protein